MDKMLTRRELITRAGALGLTAFFGGGIKSLELLAQDASVPSKEQREKAVSGEELIRAGRAWELEGEIQKALTAYAKAVDDHNEVRILAPYLVGILYAERAKASPEAMDDLFSKIKKRLEYYDFTTKLENADGIGESLIKLQKMTKILQDSVYAYRLLCTQDEDKLKESMNLLNSVISAKDAVHDLSPSGEYKWEMPSIEADPKEVERALRETGSFVMPLGKPRLVPVNATSFDTGRIVLSKAYLGIWTIHQKREDYAAASAIIQEGIKNCPGMPELHHKYAVTLYNIGKKEDAVKELRTALTFYPDYFSCHSDLARHYHSEGDLNSEQLELKECKRINPAMTQSLQKSFEK